MHLELAGNEPHTSFAGLMQPALQLRRQLRALHRRQVRGGPDIGRNRRLAKDFEATVESAATWLYIASVKLMSRRLART